MAKGRKKMARWKGAALGTGLAAAVYLLGLLLVNLLLVRGVLADGFPAAAVLCVLAALSGGLLAARLTKIAADVFTTFSQPLPKNGSSSVTAAVTLVMLCLMLLLTLPKFQLIRKGAKASHL